MAKGKITKTQKILNAVFGMDLDCVREYLETHYIDEAFFILQEKPENSVIVVFAKKGRWLGKISCSWLN